MSILDVIANSISNPVDSGYTRAELIYIARTGEKPARTVGAFGIYDLDGNKVGED